MSEIFETYETSDIVLAACLGLEGNDLIRIEKAGSKGIFIFGDVSEERIEDYNLGKIRVEPVAFNNKIRQLTSSVRRVVGR